MNDLVQPLSKLTPQEIDWLWPNNLSFGNLALFDGDPGLGKSMAALDLCAFQGMCRSSWLFGRHPVNDSQCVMAQVKNNYAPLQPALAYAVQRRDKGTTFEWRGTTKLTANQLLAAAGRKPDLPGPSERACEFLLEFLQDRPRPTTDIWPAAQKLGFTRSTLRRARKHKNIRMTRVWSANKLLSYWLLPGQNLPRKLRNDAN